MEAWKEHVVQECNSEYLHCATCGVNIYRTYNKMESIEQVKGHNCVRDLQRRLNGTENDFNQLKKQNKLFFDENERLKQEVA